MGPGEMASDRGDPNGLEEISEGDGVSVQVGGDGRVSGSRLLGRVRLLDVVPEQRFEVLASSHVWGVVRRRERALLRWAARR